MSDLLPLSPDELLTTTRSVRRRLDLERPVPLDVVREVLEVALRARGLGSAWTTLHLAYEQEIADLLGIPPTVRQGVLLPVAYTVGTDFRPAHRAPLDDVLHIDGW